MCNTIPLYHGGFVNIDLTGKKINRLTVIKLLKKRYKGQRVWKCRCECGKKHNVKTRDLTDGRTKSCGCLITEGIIKRSLGNKHGFKHGFGKHPLRAIRKAMIHRCYNFSNPYFYSYGQRGIMVCEEWKNSLETFVQWAFASGWVKGLSIDRIDENGNYTPENCRWITIQENSRRNMLKLWKNRWKDKLLSPIDSYPGLISSKL